MMHAPPLQHPFPLATINPLLQAWVEARKASDFSKFAPFLKQWVEVNQQKAKYIDPNTSAYDVLLDDYEKNMTSARLDEVFTQVRPAPSWRASMLSAAGVNMTAVLTKHLGYAHGCCNAV
jgi:Zn-dependent M32 family carboxypeptidase